jgi:hypothetical protein
MDDLEENINILQEEVMKMTSSSTKINDVKKENDKFVFNFGIVNSAIVSYVILPFLILAVLFVSKPSLLLEDNTDKTTEKKLSYKKIIVATIVLTIAINTIITIGLILYKN